MAQPEHIPFTVSSRAENELAYLEQVLQSRNLSGDGPFTMRCHAWLRRHHNTSGALLTCSGTAALELSCVLADLQPGDEVIMPSFTFSSTANAVVLRGAKPVFVDVDPKTMNLDPARLSEALSPRTRAILPIHYAGVVADMDPIMAFAAAHDLMVMEDAAQSLGSSYKGVPAGMIGDCAAISFHETKNIVCGEGGAFVTRRADLMERAEIIREKGTNRSQFNAGLVDKYSWVDIGSSLLPSEIQAAVLMAQFEQITEFTSRRMKVWARYHEAFASLEASGHLQRLHPPEHSEHNAHLYAVILSKRYDRAAVLAALHGRGVHAVFHYVPLHSAPAGKKFGRVGGPMPVTDRAGASLIRLPLFADLTDDQVERVIESLSDILQTAE